MCLWKAALKRCGFLGIWAYQHINRAASHSFMGMVLRHKDADTGLWKLSEHSEGLEACGGGGLAVSATAKTNLPLTMINHC